MGVVEPLVGHWRTGQRREVPAVGPAVDADPGQVEVGVPSGGLMQRDDLVLQRQVAAVAVHRALPTRPAARGWETRKADCAARTRCPPGPPYGSMSTGSGPSPGRCPVGKSTVHRVTSAPASNSSTCAVTSGVSATQGISPPDTVTRVPAYARLLLVMTVVPPA